jgi:hypothetical protein
VLPIRFGRDKKELHHDGDPQEALDFMLRALMFLAGNFPVGLAAYACNAHSNRHFQSSPSTTHIPSRTWMALYWPGLLCAWWKVSSPVLCEGPAVWWKGSSRSVGGRDHD